MSEAKKPDLVDLVGIDMDLHRMVHICIEAGREFDVVILLSKCKWAKHYEIDHGEVKLVERLNKLAEMGFLHTFDTRGGTRFWRYEDNTIDGLCVAMASGCTNEEIKSAPEWFKAEMRIRGDLVGDERRWRA